MGRRRARRARTGRGRRRLASAPLTIELRPIKQELKGVKDYLCEIGLVVKARKPSVVLGPHVQDDLEREVVRRFLDGEPHRTPELAPVMGKDRRQVLRIIRRINRRVKRAEGVEPFHFDPSTRTWQLEIEIVDQKELR